MLIISKYIYLALAIIFEVLGTTSMKFSDGMKSIGFVIIMLIFYILSLSMLSMALKNWEVGVAYAIWSGFGITLITTIGIMFFNESISISKVFFILLIIIGAIGLNLVTTSH
ncbi:multidrug efflux SMR transporter [Clostridium saccharobutylicum]|uniref:DMT family transporter n=1 Tax=Clostridium saccharobutylicum TaxID=169679 RepID=UPI003119CB9E